MIQKEFRALLPAWAACAVTLLASANVSSDTLRELGPLVYFVGAASLGAMSIGHEYSRQTIGLLLSQPVSRRRVLLTKQGVLAVMLGALLAVAGTTVSLGRGDPLFGTAFVWLPALAALFITPWLTMATRSPMAGAVFTLSITGIVLVAAEWIGESWYGYTREVDTFRVAVLWRTMIALCAIGAVMTWWTFSRLQAIDGRDTELDFAPRASVAPRRLTRRSAGWLLVRKELRIQQLAFALAGLYVAGYLWEAFSRSAPSRFDDPTTLGALLHAGLLAMMIGSTASAEERNMRTLDSQLLLPMRASHQWHIKTGVALGLTFVLALALPAALIWILPPESPAFSRVIHQLFAIKTVVPLAALAVLSLYVSSLCPSGLWALVVSAPVAFGVAVFVAKLGEVMLHSLDDRTNWQVVEPSWQIVERSAVLLTAAVIVVVLRLALANHRSADRDHWRTATQVAIIGGAITAAVAIVGLAGALSR